ncbi:hypothetical protein DERP_014327 [Dermatophagoides pteronyssinus]|uniref:Uncharacterized protein n=1 Tax=Dermatophagoides pteronyssinus TaxID=6956 RepID=A0ABQ8JXB9_DERPT|nr:hypothetical protein DERP_014327 [Dermatophagoides pteronyssinus]
MDAKSYDSDSNEDDEIQQEKMEKFLLSLNNIKYRSKRRTKFQRINSPPTPILELNYTRPTKMNGLKSSKLTVRMKNPNRRRKKTVQKKRSTMKMNYKTIDDDFDVDEPVQRRRPSRLSRLSRNFQSINRQRLEPKRSVSLSKTSLKRAREMFVKHLEQIILESMSKIVQQQKQIDREISSLRNKSSDEKLLNTIDKNDVVDSESKLFKTFEFKTDPKIIRNGFGGKFMKKNVIIRCSENIDTFKTNESTTTTTTDIDKKNDDKISKQKSLNKEVENCSATSIDC